MHEPTSIHGAILAFSNILDAFGEGLLIVSPDNRVACINNHLRHLLGITHDAPTEIGADHFVLQTLIPRICGEPGRIEVAAFLSGRTSAADLLCAMRLPDGSEGWFYCSCRAVHDGQFRGSRLIRFLPAPRAALAPRTTVDGRGEGIDAAKRRQIEEILHGSENRYQFLVENLNEGIALIDREGIVIFANRRIAEIAGYPVTEIVGASLFLFVDEAGARRLKGYLQILDQNKREIFEIDLIRGGGGRVHSLMATTPIIDASGACRGFLLGIQNITPLKQMEARLRESEEKYRSLVELSAEATLIHQDGIITYINPAGMRLLGAQDSEGIVGKNILDIIHPEFRDLIRSFTARNLQGEETPLIELPIIRLDGTTVLVEGRGTRTLFAGRPAIQTIARDITRRKQAGEQLQARNRHLLLLNRIISMSSQTRTPDELLKMVLDLVLDSLDVDGGGIYLAESGEEGIMLHYEREMPERCRERVEGFLNSPYAETFAPGVPHYLERSDDPDDHVSRLLRDLGFAALACVPLFIESDTIGILVIGNRERGSFSDDERALFEAIGREIGAGILRGLLYRKLEAANREANLYLDILTHDIRNADNVANIYADLLIDELEGEPARHARKLKVGIRKSIEITANVATLRKIQEGRAGLVRQNLHDVIQDEIAHFPDLCIRYSGQPVEVLADDLLPEIFTNLIGNAAKHGGPDVEVTVAVDDQDEETVAVIVADTGPGVPDDAKEMIFFRFEREGGRRGSQGLGLSICRMLAARYGGRIRVEDRVPGRPGEGAAFRFTLRKAGRDGGV